MIGEYLGPYRIVSVMGEGGTGRVYRGVDRYDVCAAIKTPKGNSTLERDALRRETAALARLAEFRHPGVVSFITSGTARSGGLPWYAMELVDGRDLVTYRDELWSGSRASDNQTDSQLLPTTMGPSATSFATATTLSVFDQVAERRCERQLPKLSPVLANRSLQKILRLTALLADALDFLHSEGLVHGDLSARNVLVQNGSDQPVLVDFGTSFEAQAAGVARDVTHVRSLYATEAYMAPERKSDSVLDARCDLYALGCVMYELLTNVRPQVRHGSQTRAPSALVTDISPELDQLVMALLAPDPLERRGHALDVARAVREMLEKSEANPLPPKPPRRSARLYRARLIGRARELRRLTQLVTEARDGRGRLVVIQGESGIGKTRLSNELAAFASVNAFRVISSMCRQPDVERNVGSRNLEPFFPFLAHVSDCCADVDPGFAGLYKQHACFLQPFAPEVLIGVEPAIDPSSMSHEQARIRAARALGQLLLLCAQNRPLMLIIDDLQWADDFTLEVLAHESMEYTHSRLLIVATMRDEQAQRVRDALSTQVALCITLERLTAGQIRTMAGDMLGAASTPESLAPFLFRNSDGNPFFAAEYLRAALLGGLLERSAHDAGWTFHTHEQLNLPSSLEELLDLRLEGLSRAALSSLQLGAVLGSEFEVAELAALPESMGLKLELALDELVSRQLLEWVAPGRYRFVHSKIREAQELAIAPNEKRRLHRLAAMHLASQENQASVDEGRLGLHWLQAGEPQLALPLLDAAARAAMSAHEPGRAAEYSRLALVELSNLGIAQQELPALLCSLLEVHADALLALAQHTAAREHYQRVAELEREPLARARLFRKLGTSHSIQHQYDEAQVWLERASEALGDPSAQRDGGHHEYIEIQIRRLEQLYFARRIGEHTAQLIRELSPVVEVHGQPAQRCHFGVGAACELAARQRYAWNDEALLLARRAATAGETAGALNQLALAQLTVGFLLMPGTRNHCQEGIDWLLRAEVNARLLGDNTLLCRVLTYQAITRLRLGDEKSLAASLSELFEAAQTAQLPPYVALNQACEAWLLWRTERSPRAEELANRAITMWDAHPHVFPFQWPATLTLLDILCAQDRPQEMPVLMERLLKPEQQQLPQELCMRLERALQARDSSMRAFAAACSDVMACAERLHFC